MGEYGYRRPRRAVGQVKCLFGIGFGVFYMLGKKYLVWFGMMRDTHRCLFDCHYLALVMRYFLSVLSDSLGAVHSCMFESLFSYNTSRHSVDTYFIETIIVEARKQS